MDAIGRRPTITMALICLGVSLGFLPFVYPDFFLLYLLLIAEDIFMASLQASPLLTDYATRESQGKAFSTNSIGMNLGTIIGTGIFVTVIRYLDIADQLKLIFALAGIIILVYSILTPFMIIEPPDLKHKIEKQEKKEVERRLSIG